MIILDHLGEPLTHQKIVPGNTVTSLAASCYNYKEFTLQLNGVDSGSTAASLAAGTWITEATTYARAVVVSATLDSGSWGNANARVTCRIKSSAGTWTAGHNVTSGADLDVFTIRTGTTAVEIPGDYPNRGRQAKAALVSVYAQTALVDFIGSTIDQTSLIGQPMAAASSIILADINQIKAFSCVDYTGSSASTVQITYFF